MCVFKQGENWWYEFHVDGKRYRSSGTPIPLKIRPT
jgi:hypothetical protein